MRAYFLALVLVSSIAVVGCSDEAGEAGGSSGASGTGGVGGSRGPSGSGGASGGGGNQMVLNIDLGSETFASESAPESCITALYARVVPVAGAVRYSAFTFGHDETSEQWLAGTRPVSATWTPDMGPRSLDAFFPNGMRDGNFAFVETTITSLCVNTETHREARIRQTGLSSTAQVTVSFE